MIIYLDNQRESPHSSAYADWSAPPWAKDRSAGRSVVPALSPGSGIGPKRVPEMLWKPDGDFTTPPTSFHTEHRWTPDSSDTESAGPGEERITHLCPQWLVWSCCLQPQGQPTRASQDAVAKAASPAQQGSGAEEIELFLKLLMLLRVSQTHCLGKVLLKNT